MSAAVHPSQGPVGGPSYRSSELLVALFGALSVVAWTLALLSLESNTRANAPHITAGDAVPVKVKPVLDTESPLLKGKGKRVRAKMPAMWAKEPPPRPTPQTPKKGAKVSTKAKDDVDDIPDPDKPVVDAGKEEDADTENAGGAPPVDPGVGGGKAEGGGPPSAGLGDGGAGPGQGGDSEDPLRAIAYQRYLGRAQSRFYGGFACPQNLATDCTATALFSVSGDGTVQSFTFTPCGNPAVDGPAQSAASSSVGKQLPPPPEKYPEFLKSQWSISYRCTAKANATAP